MNHPPYHLRPNKAVDRYLLMDCIKNCHIPAKTQRKSRYIGFGGPFMEDFRLMHHTFPDLSLVCIESNKQTHRRQLRHKPCRNIEFQQSRSSDYFLHEYTPGTFDIIWLDYTELDLSTFSDVATIVQKSNFTGIIKITINASQESNLRLTEIPRQKDATEKVDPAFSVALDAFLTNITSICQSPKRIFSYATC